MEGTTIQLFDTNPLPSLMVQFELYNLLPTELRLYPLQFLTIPELLKVCSVCKEWYHTISTWQSIWRGVFVKLKITGRNEIKSDNAIEETERPPIYKPSERVCHASIVYEDTLLVFGGHIPNDSDHIGTVRNDLWEYSFTNCKWTLLKMIAPVTEVQGVYWNDNFVIYGGFVQAGRRSHIIFWDCIVVGSKRNSFGGWDGRESMNDLWKFDLVNKTWRFVVSHGVVAPRVRSHAAVVYGNSMYVTGGYGAEKHCEDLYRFCFDTGEWSIVATKGTVRPSPRSRVRSVVYDNRMYIYGGWNRKSLCKELWEFNFDTLCWKEIQVTGMPTAGLAQYSMAVHNDMLVVFGGFCGVPSNELYGMKLFKETREDEMELEEEELLQIAE